MALGLGVTERVIELDPGTDNIVDENGAAAELEWINVDEGAAGEVVGGLDGADN